MVLDHSGTVPDSTAGFSLFARFPVPPVCFFSATGATSFLLRQGAPPVSLFRFWPISFFSPLLFRLIPGISKNRNVTAGFFSVFTG